MKRILYYLMAGAVLFSCAAPAGKDLPREAPSEALAAAFQTLQDSIVASFAEPLDYMKILNLHSIMVVKDGKVVLEKWFHDYTPEKPHSMFSISKTFTATAVGMAIAEGKMKLDDRVADYFPDKVLPDNPCEATVKDLLMMAGGHETDPTMKVLQIDAKNATSRLVEGADPAAAFFSHPFVRKPGTYFWYDSLCTYILSAIVTKVTGESVLDYLTPRLFEPLGIEKPVWEADDNGISAGGWGLCLKTEDMAKMGLLLLQNGRWGNRQLVPADWVAEMGKAQIDCAPANVRIEEAEAVSGVPDAENDWRYGYGFQTWQNKKEGFRADGAGGQFILVLPEKNAVVVMTAWQPNTQRQLDFIWNILYPAL